MNKSSKLVLDILCKYRYSARISVRSFCDGRHQRDDELTTATKLAIETHWKSKLHNPPFDELDTSRAKYYVLSMFPYPSGQLHMGHVRVYTISDTMARFHRMTGKNVLHPMGWDAFGLPAENAAIDRNVSAVSWTRSNMEYMKKQLVELGCSFEWDREIVTSEDVYYKWTQYLFLKMFEEGLVYQKEALVNWDPIDETVLADEQVDANGCSWRSGAKVEKKLLKQWYIRTTKYAKRLLDGLDDPMLEDWKDILKLQKHWIGECNGYSFDFELLNVDTLNTNTKHVSVWAPSPESFFNACFIAVAPNSVLDIICYAGDKKQAIRKLDIVARNPFNNYNLPIYVTDKIEFATGSDVHLGVPHLSQVDKEFVESVGIPENPYNELTPCDLSNFMQKISDAGGCKTSSKLKDWLISRQRYWGTPIPVVHCSKCGTQPVPIEQLPVKLPEINRSSTKGRSILAEKSDWLKTLCPKCSGDAVRETDTMDTFVDSSWYYLRYLDNNNTKKPFCENKAARYMPVDLYIGGKEHAVLHLYYARFMNHFLHSIGLVKQPEPFRRLLVQGMVMGRSFRVKGTGRYIAEDEVDIFDAKKGKAVERSTGQPVVMTWEKMSKSKQNGVDPQQMFRDYGTDTTRLLILADVAPTSHRNWSTATFPGILNWQKRLWLTIQEFVKLRTNAEPININDADFIEHEMKMFDARNYYIKGATFNYFASHQLSVAISKMQGLTNSIRRSSSASKSNGLQFERALAAQIIMLAPMAPHFASELWARFTSVPQLCLEERVYTSENTSLSHHQVNEINWKKPVLEQPWPEVDQHYELDLDIKVNGFDNCSIKLPRSELDHLSQEKALKIALDQNSVSEYISTRGIRSQTYHMYPGCRAELNLFTKYTTKEKSVEATTQ